MQELYDNTKKSRLTNTTKENNYYYEPIIKTAREEDSVYAIKFYALNKQIEQLTKEKQQLIKFLKDKIKEIDEKINAFYETYIDKNCPYLELKLEAFQEVLDFVNKGGIK